MAHPQMHNKGFSESDVEQRPRELVLRYNLLSIGDRVTDGSLPEPSFSIMQLMSVLPGE
jgi:hypothetical protein